MPEELLNEVVVDEVVKPPVETLPTKTGPEEKTEPPGPEFDVVVEGEEPSETKVEGTGEEDELTKLQSQYTNLEQKLRDSEQRELGLAQQLQDKKRQEPPKEPKEPIQEKLTREQLLGIIEEYKDKPEFGGILLNIIDHVAEQKATGIRDETMQGVEHQQWHNQLNSIESRALSEDPLLSKRPDIVAKLPAMAEALRLGDHPMGRFIAYQMWRAGEGSAAIETDSAETTRVKKLETEKNMDKTTIPSKKSVTLSKDQAAMADRLGVSRQLYARFIPTAKEAS